MSKNLKKKRPIESEESEDDYDEGGKLSDEEEEEDDEEYSEHEKVNENKHNSKDLLFSYLFDK